MRTTLALALFLTGCNTLAWKAIDDPGHYGSRYQRAEYKRALPCRNWCWLVAHIRKEEREQYLVVRGGPDGLTCSCVRTSSSQAGRALMSLDEKQHTSAFGDWIVTRMPADAVEALSVEDLDAAKAAGMKVVQEVAAEAAR